MEENECCNQVVSYERNGKIAIISINRPERLNALNRSVYHEIKQSVERANTEPGVHVIILRGSDKHFAAGADVNDLANATMLEAEAYIKQATDCTSGVYMSSLPVIAYLRGYVLGGGLEVALACDIRIAGDDVKLSLPEVTLGIIPGSGGTQRLPLLIGPAMAKELIMTGRIVDATEALRLGLVNHVYEGDQTWREVLGLAKKIAAQPLQAVRKGKATVNSAMQLNIWDGLQYEGVNCAALIGTPDQRERMNAFLNKNKS